MNLGTYADGRAIGYDEQTGTLDVSGTAITPQQLREYDDAGQVTWAAEGNRAWLDTSFPPGATAAASLKRRKVPVLAIVIGVVLLLGLCGVIASLTPTSTPSTTPAAQVAPTTPAAEVASSPPAAEASAAAVPVAPAAPAPVAAPAPAPVAPAAPAPAKPALSVGQQAAVDKAQSYLDMGGFSHKSLIGQLTYEGFSKSEATFAVDHIAPDWNAQAAQKAQSYMDMGGFSRKSLIGQLTYEGFTSSQAKYGAKSVGY